MIAVLGISAFYHDSAAALIVDGKIVAAAQEERFTRAKHDPGFPINAVRFVLQEAGIDLADVDHIVFYESPKLKFARLALGYLAFAPKGFHVFAASLTTWLGGKLWHRRLIRRHLSHLLSHGKPTPPISFSEHHTSHAASAFYPSPFDDAVVLTIDGVGEFATTTVSIANGRSLDRVKEIRFPHSLGLLYSTFTQYVGFKVNSGEYKLMGLAPYGQPRFTDVILDNLIDVKPDGSFRLNQKYFAFQYGRQMINADFQTLFGAPARRDEKDPITQFHKDIAASIQAVMDKIILNMATALAGEYGSRNLCLAGGVALNCVANGKLKSANLFDRIWVQPAPGDAGGALGAALWFWHEKLGQPRVPALPDAMQGGYLGPSFSDEEIADSLSENNAVFHSLPTDKMIDLCANALDEGKAVGWFQGRMEFGPRALGARSILADPRRKDMQRTLNLKIKKRESFRPFAPVVLLHQAERWFSDGDPNRYMQFVVNVSGPRDRIPAVTHVDGSARVQTVEPQANPLFCALLSRFQDLTGCPVLINTSFNVRGEPIVCRPVDAWRCFMSTDLDVLAIGGHILFKHEQTDTTWKEALIPFAPD